MGSLGQDGVKIRAFMTFKASRHNLFRSERLIDLGCKCCGARNRVWRELNRFRPTLTEQRGGINYADHAIGLREITPKLARLCIHILG